MLKASNINNNLVFLAHTKHIEIDNHFIREKVIAGDIQLRCLPTTQQIVNIFSKALSKDSFAAFCYKLGIHPSSLPILMWDAKNNNVTLIQASKESTSYQENH